MSEVKIRPRKDGGLSECSSPDEMVGKGRCCHVIGDSGEQVMSLNRVQRGFYEIKLDGQTVNVEGQNDTVVKFFDSLGKLDDKKVQAILKFLNEEG